MSDFDPIALAKSHPVAAGLLIVVAGVAVYWLLGGFSSGSSGQSADTSGPGNVAGYYAAEAAQTNASAQVQIAQAQIAGQQGLASIQGANAVNLATVQYAGENQLAINRGNEAVALTAQQGTNAYVLDVQNGTNAVALAEAGGTEGNINALINADASTVNTANTNATSLFQSYYNALGVNSSNQAANYGTGTYATEYLQTTGGLVPILRKVG